jgi:serine/threonine protein kinase/Tfp pilus assembly protein PilF
VTTGPQSEPTAHDPASERFAEALARQERGEPIDAGGLAAGMPELGAALDLLGQLDTLVGAGQEPTALGDFRILREIGRGGMGVVYEAEQLSLGRRVALKLLPQAGAADERRLRRFQTEARATATLQHPHIVPVYAVGAEADTHWYAMQLIDGVPLSAVSRAVHADWRALGSRPAIEQILLGGLGAMQSGRAAGSAAALTRQAWLRLAAWWVADAADAVHHAHQAGILHRDLKPGNLLADQTGRIWVADFGLSWIAAESTHMTVSGEVLGTLAYCSPEQASGADTDARTDVYGLGATLYELVTGRAPSAGDSRADALRRVLHEDPLRPSLLEPAVPADLETILLECLHKEPRQRYATAAELAADLRAFLADRPIRARRAGPLERLARWARREPWRAAALAIVIVAVPALAAFTAFTIARAPVVAAAERLAGQRQIEQALAEGFLALGNDNERAHAAFGRALALDPDQVEAESGHVIADLELRRFGPARERIERLRARHPRVAELLRIHALQYQQQPGAAEALERLGEPRDRLEEFLAGVTSRQHARTLRATDDTRSRELLQRAYEFLDRAVLRSPTPRLEYHAERAQAAAALGLTASARAAAQALRDLWPESGTAWHAIGGCLHMLPSPEDQKACREAFERAVELNPDRPTNHLALGTVLLNQGDAERAIPWLERYLARHPNDPSGLCQLAKAQFGVGRRKEAFATIRRSLELDPKNRLHWLELGLLEHHTGDLDGALAAYRSSLAIDPDAADPAAVILHRNLVTILIDRDLREARAAAERGVALTRRRDGFLLAQLADLQWLANDREAALATLEEALPKLDPREPTTEAMRADMQERRRTWRAELGKK